MLLPAQVYVCCTGVSVYSMIPDTHCMSGRAMGARPNVLIHNVRLRLLIISLLFHNIGGWDLDIYT